VGRDVCGERGDRAESEGVGGNGEIEDGMSCHDDVESGQPLK